jgi:hypothetical protein
MKTLTLIATLCAVLLASSLCSFAFDLSVPEKLVYDIKWTGIKAGTAVHEVSAQGRELRLLYTVHSAGWLKPVFFIDDKTESVLSRDTGPVGMPKLYREKINEGKTHNFKEAQFDRKNLLVQTRDLLKKTEKSEPISARTFDTLSSIYFLRSSELAPGKLILLDIYDCKRLWSAEAKVVRREEVSTPAGTFQTLMVTTQLKAEGIPPRPDYLTVWFTDDSRRIPVKMTSKLKVGELTALLSGGSYWPK